jgi:hypothetical protein
MSLEPKYSASASLSSLSGGGLVLDGISGAVAVALAPFYQGADGGFPSPTIPAFTSVTGAAKGAIIESDDVEVSGDAGTVWPAVVRGDGNAEMRINAGAWATSGMFRVGDSLRLRLVSAATAGTALSAMIYAQGVAAAWAVTTAITPRFVPVGSDALITADGETFRVKDE